MSDRWASVETIMEEAERTDSRVRLTYPDTRFHARTTTHPLTVTDAQEVIRVQRARCEYVDGAAVVVEECEKHGHTPVAGAMIVHPEDIDTVAASRRVECQRCDAHYQPQTRGWVDNGVWTGHYS